MRGDLYQYYVGSGRSEQGDVGEGDGWVCDLGHLSVEQQICKEKTCPSANLLKVVEKLIDP